MTDRSLIERLAALFRGAAGASGTHGVPVKDSNGLKWKINTTARTLREPVTILLWEQHVAGTRPLGVVPIREDSTASWASIDFDQYNIDLSALIKRVEDAKLPLVPCRSKSGGLHLFLFLVAPEPAQDVVEVMRDAAASLGLSDCEIFPKQTQVLSDKHDMGNWMVMPYFGGTFDGKLKLQHGLKRGGAEMSLLEFVTVAENRRVTTQDVRDNIARRGERALGNGKRRGSKGKGSRHSPCDYSDGPPCLLHLFGSGGLQGDGRRRSLFHAAIYLRRADPENWRTRIEEQNQKFDTPLQASEVAGIIRSNEKKDYEYTCKEEPMRSHCNSSLCKTKRFGVGTDGDVPVISNLQLLASEPPVWFVTVSDHRLEMSSEQLQNFHLFQRICMHRVQRTFKPVKQEVWASILDEAMLKMDQGDRLPVPPEVKKDAEFLELLSEFCNNRARAERKQDMLTGRPWHDPETGRFYFSVRHLLAFMAQEGIRSMNRSQIITAVMDMKGGNRQFSFDSKHSINVVWVPAARLHSFGVPDSPKIEGDEI